LNVLADAASDWPVEYFNHDGCDPPISELWLLSGNQPSWLWLLLRILPLFHIIVVAVALEFVVADTVNHVSQ
jgi:hypothetical protein